MSGMRVYRLEPIKGAEHHHYWKNSALPPVTVWVQATSPAHARQRVQRAVSKLDSAETDNIDRSPWSDTALVRCIEDPSRTMPEDIALLADGNITLKVT
jgi:hypothetical protein